MSGPVIVLLQPLPQETELMRSLRIADALQGWADVHHPPQAFGHVNLGCEPYRPVRPSFKYLVVEFGQPMSPYERWREIIHECRDDDVDDDAVRWARPQAFAQ